MAAGRLAAWREKRGFSQAELAQSMGVEVSTVYRWEHGLSKLRPGQRARLARRLSCSLDELNAMLLADAEDAARAAGDEDALERLRRDLDEVLSGHAPGAPTLDEWEQTALRHALATRDTAADDLLVALADDLAELMALIPACRSSSALRRLTRVAAQLSGLVVLTLVKLDDRASFTRWARTARIAGAEAGDIALYSWILAQEAYGHFYADKHVKAIAVARQAQDVAGTSPCVGVPLAAALEARAHAARGDTEQAGTALQRAELGLEQLPQEDLQPSALGYGESQLRFHQSSTYTLLGDSTAAWLAQDRALALCAPGDFTDWAMTRLDRAACLAHDGDLTGAMGEATSTFTQLTDAQRAGIIANRGRELIAGLPAAQRALPAVDELRDLVDTGD